MYEKMLLTCGAQRSEYYAKASIALYGELAGSQAIAAHRWSFWEKWHEMMGQHLTIENIVNFQSDQILAPQIIGGGGETYIEKTRDLMGSDFGWFMNAYGESRCGNPADLSQVNGVPITRTAMRHLYHVAVLKKCGAIFDLNAVNFVEIGGGFGNFARILRWYDSPNRHYIVDFPPSIAIMHFFLSCNGLADDLAVVHQNRFIMGNASARIVLVAADSLDYLKTIENAFLISTMAMTEISDDGKAIYLANNDYRYVYIYGQTIVRGGAMGIAGVHAGSVDVVDNRAFFDQLAQRFMPVQCWEDGYYTSFLGKSYGSAPS